MTTKYNVDEIVMVPMRVGSIEICNSGEVYYTLLCPHEMDGINCVDCECDMCNLVIQYREDRIKAVEEKEGNDSDRVGEGLE